MLTKGEKTTVFLVSFLWVLAIAVVCSGWMFNFSHMVSPFAATITVVGAILMAVCQCAIYMPGCLLRKKPRVPVARHTFAPDITIVIVANNAGKAIYDTVHSMKSQLYAGKIYTIVLDDGSTDDTALQLSKNIQCGDLVRYVPVPHKITRSNITELILENVRTQYFVLLNQDIWLYKNCLSLLVDEMIESEQRGKNVFAVQGSVFIRNSRDNMLVKLIEQFYFAHNASKKRSAGMFDDTVNTCYDLVVYNTNIVRLLGSICYKEAKSLLGYRTVYCEQAVGFMRVENSLFAYLDKRGKKIKANLNMCRKYLGRRKRNFAVWIRCLETPVINGVYTLTALPQLWVFCATSSVLGLLPLLSVKILSLFIYGMIMDTQYYDVFKPLGLHIRKHKLAIILYATIGPILLLASDLVGILYHQYKKKNLPKRE